MAQEKSCIFIRDLAVDMMIGVYDHEKQARQRVVVNVEAWLKDRPDWKGDDLSKTLNYERIVSAIHYLARRGHTNLVEAFAERIADFCLEDRRLAHVRVKVEKPEIAAFAGAAVGVDITRARAA